MDRVRSFLSALAVTALVLTGGLVSAAPAGAVSATDYDPSFIISDAAFYDVGTMNAGQIQSFIDTKGSRCNPSSGNTCLKSYRETTNTIPADSYCSAYQGAGSETAAQIIAKVSAACRINPQVLLVTLQKEQGLVTSTTGKPAATFQRAFGYGCPDNVGGWCDPSYAGFFVQMQRAARQFQVYKARPTSYQYVAGKWNTIQNHPNAACGSNQVFIQNQATAALYIYTPYVPNAAALAAGYGTGDSCSSYGNRNFFLYFSDWFGSTGIVLSQYIWDWYQVPSNRAMAGEVTTQATGTSGGVRQGFQGGTVYVSGSYGVHLVPAGLLALYYDSLNGPAGVLGFPSGSHSSPAGGLSQPYQNGTVFISGATGFAYVSGWILDIYKAAGGPAGSMGFPTSGQSIIAGGITQSFQSGTVWISGAGGVQTLRPVMQAAYTALAGPSGSLGFPTSAETTAAGVTTQQFQNGVLYSDGTTAHAVVGWMLDIFKGSGGPQGALGMPLESQRTEAGGIVQRFAKGTVYISGVGGVQVVPATIAAPYAASKGAAGPLGFPVGPATTTGTVVSQPFQWGVLYSDGTTSGYVSAGMMADVYRSRGGLTGELGLPLESTRVVGGGLVQAFSTATMYVSGVGGVQKVLRGSLVEMFYSSLGGPTGTLGWPAGSQTGAAGGVVQKFTNGTVYISGMTGFTYATSWMADVYRQRGGPEGALGFPTSSTRTEAGGLAQSFQNGAIYISGIGGAQTVPAVILKAYSGNGGPAGALGFPVSAAVVTATETTQNFQGGTISVTAAGLVTITPR